MMHIIIYTIECIPLVLVLECTNHSEVNVQWEKCVLKRSMRFFQKGIKQKKYLIREIRHAFKLHFSTLHLLSAHDCWNDKDNRYPRVLPAQKI